MKILRTTSLAGVAILVVLVATTIAQTQVIFTDVSENRGILPYQMAYGKGGSVAAADFDNDGDVDLFLPTASGIPDQLYRNIGNGSFEEIAATAGVASMDANRAALWFDFDGDHLLDLFVAGDCFEQDGSCPQSSTLKLYRQFEDAKFEDVSTAAGFANDSVVDTLAHRGPLSAGDINGDGYLDLLVNLWAGEAQLFLNQRDGTFTDITVTSGLGGTGRLRSHWQSMMHDFNGDGLLDIYSNIDFAPNLLWVNQGDNTFEDRAIVSGSGNKWNDMGLTLGDYDNDGDLDLYITNITTASRNNVLLRNESIGDNLSFSRAAIDAGVAYGGVGWGCTFFDANNDGWLDVAATNGFFHGSAATDSSKFWMSSGGAPVTFVDVSDKVGFNDDFWGSSLIAVDTDRDGDLDLLQTCNGSGPQPSLFRLLENQPQGAAASNNYLVVKPRMPGANYWAIGAVVRIRVGQLSMMRLISAGTSVFGQEPAEAFFGIGESAEVDEVSVEWPDGTKTFLENIDANQQLVIEQPANQDLVFTDVASLSGMDLPNTLNESLAWGDYDNDGDEDLYLTNNGPNRLFRNDGNDVFTDVSSIVGVDNDLFSVGCAFGDLDNDGDLDLYVVNFGAGHDVLYRNDGPVLAGGEFQFTDITISAGTTVEESSRGMAFVDFDRDGLLDIYVNAIGEDILYHNKGNLQFENVASQFGIVGAGGQGVGVVGTDVNNDGWPDIYNANRSFDLSNLFINSNGLFTDIANSSGIQAIGLGMGILSFDYDNDLDMDLYWTTWPGNNVPETNKLYQNQGNGSQFVDVARQTGTADSLGWGISCNAGDVDNDGWMDFFVTNGFDDTTTPNVLFHNQNGSSFADITNLIGGGDFDGRGVAFADYDGDGDLDLCVTGGPNDNTKLWRNDSQTDNHWLHITLAGERGNKSAIGAAVQVTTSLDVTTVQEVSGGAGRGSFNSLPLEFGLGKADSVVAISVRWPSGLQQSLPGTGVDRALTLFESAITSIEDERPELPGQFSLSQNYPNPFNPTTTIQFALAAESRVSLSIYNVLGELVQTLISGQIRSAGQHQVSWDGRNSVGAQVASGVYLASLQSEREVESRKMLLIR